MQSKQLTVKPHKPIRGDLTSALEIFSARTPMLNCVNACFHITYTD